MNLQRVQTLLDQCLPPHPNPPTALFLSGDVLAPAVCGDLQRRGIHLGREMDVVSCNNEQMLLSHLYPRPATLDIHAERIGQKAVEQLLWRIENPGAPRATTALEPTLVAGIDADTNSKEPSNRPDEQEILAV